MSDYNDKIKKGLQEFEAEGNLDAVSKELHRNIDSMLASDTSEITKVKATSWTKYVIFTILFLLVMAAIYKMSVTDTPQVEQVSPDVLFAQHFEVFPDAVFGDVRGESSSKEDISDFERAMYLYNDGSYDKAAAALEDIDGQPISKLYAGIAYLESGNTEKSIALLESLKNNKKVKTFSDVIEWNLALAYLKASQKEKAKLLLLDIVSSDHYRSKNAKEILDKI